MNKFHLFFDIDGVLLKNRTPEEMSWSKESQILGIDLNFIMQEFFRNHFHKVLIGKASLVSTLDNLIKPYAYNMDVEKITTIWFEKELDVNNKLFYYLNLLLKHPQVTLYVASNQSRERAKFLLDKLKLSNIFTIMFFSAEIGLLKSTPKFFKIVKRLINVEKNSLLILFDDDINNINSAKKAGWNGYLYENLSLFLNNILIRKLLKELIEGNYGRIQK